MNTEHDSRGSEHDPSNALKWEAIRKKIFQQKHISIMPYTLKELAEIYKVCVPTFKRMLEPFEKHIGKHQGRYYSIPQVKMIFQSIDLPSTYTLTDLAHIYNVSVPTFKGWVDRFQGELGEKAGHFYSLRQLYIIISKLDIPSLEGKEQDDFAALLQLCSRNDLLLLYGYLLYSFTDYFSLVECLVNFC